MIVVTNRNILPDHLEDAVFCERCFGDGFNEKGPDELRLARAEREDGKWRLSLQEDQTAGVFASESEFLALRERMTNQKRDCVFFIHGFNTSLEDALNHAEQLESNFGVETILFSWPANRVGFQRGISYRSDKRDAKNSVNALDRIFEKLDRYLKQHTGAEHPCGQTMTLLAHSMGCYLLKSLMNSSVYQNETLLFDNIVLAAADVNNDDHAAWVDRIAHRHRLSITINERDASLLLARAKWGEHQLARLGHWPHNLNAKNAIYFNFTGADKVGSSHVYFEGKPLENPVVKQVFTDLFSCRAAEQGLEFNSATGAFQVE